MSGADIALLAVLAVLVVLALRRCWKNRGRCCGDCTACRRACGNRKDTK